MFPTRNVSLNRNEESSQINQEKVSESLKLPVVQGGEDSNADIREKRDTVRKVMYGNSR